MTPTTRLVAEERLCATAAASVHVIDESGHPRYAFTLLLEQVMDSAQGAARVPSRSRFLCRHIDQVAEIAGSYRHVAIGCDFDGFIKPTLAGLQTMADMGRLEAALVERYGEA